LHTDKASLLIRLEYEKAGVEDRDPLISEIENRLSEAQSRKTKALKDADPSQAMQQRMRLAKQEGDELMTQAATALGAKDFVGARELAEQAQQSFRAAGMVVYRERGVMVENLLSYIAVEEEREITTRKRKDREDKQQAEANKLMKRVETAVWGPDEPDNIATAPQTVEEDSNAKKPDLCILVDNGSSRAGSTLQLRQIATSLSQRIGVEVVPASMMHANRAEVDDLGGVPAQLFEPLMQDYKNKLKAKRLAGHEKDVRVVVLPLFLGPVKSVMTTIPSIMQGISKDISRFRWEASKPLSEHPNLVDMIEEEILRVVEKNALQEPCVVVVDHGSPNRDVTAVRDRIAADIKDRLVSKSVSSTVQPASMERKPGDEFSFADPLLETALPEVGDGNGDVVLSQLFLLPGTHAGAGGDIDEICENALDTAGVDRAVYKTALLGEMQGLIDLLQQQYEGAVEGLCSKAEK